MPPCPCPACGKKLDAATKLNDTDQPRAGDFSICFHCGVYLRFNEDSTTLRVATVDDFRKLSTGQMLVMRAAARLIRKRAAERKAMDN